LAEALGNFLSGGVFGFMITPPQLNLFARGTQWSVKWR
jgi:nitric oxide reductase subunit B